MHNKLKLFTVLLASCYFGSSVPEGRAMSKMETTAAQCVIDLVEPDPGTASYLLGLGILAGPSDVGDLCSPSAASCALLVEGEIVYDGSDLGALVHEVLHHYEWVAYHRVDYGHSDPELWGKSGGEYSVEWGCRHEKF